MADLVLLHAGVTDRRGWAAVAARLAGAGHHPVAYDRLGHGEAAGAEREPGFTHLADLRRVVEDSASGPAWLVGSSMGGALALDAALAFPQRLAGLVLIAPAVSGAPDPSGDELDPATRALDERMEAVASGVALNRLETWLWLDGPAQPEGRVGGAPRRLALAMNAAILAAAVDGDEGASGIDAWERLEEIALPTWVAWGEHDVPFLIERSRTVAGRIPGARTRELSGTAHLPMLDAPDAVADLVLDALA